ncbi:probable xyloglucan galactosyltransferase GT11 [Syzygium oleosum]|uniref:probable xyloglucan galactosyltransferase GT11 n=1 Tax=Syzygium oleosum TaxID=219896 RepID=UPI0024BA8D62|nr:probable xyloglucan galactosyltransferase GT11 [Syzygium oleosum]
MEKSLVVMCWNRLWFVILAGFLLWFVLISLFRANPIRLVNYSPIYLAENYTQSSIVWSDDANTEGEIRRPFEGIRFKEDAPDSSSVEGVMNRTHSSLPSSEIAEEKTIRENGEADSMSCEGRRVYIHKLPRQFNEDLLRQCKSLSTWMNMCDSLANFGLGPRLANSNKVLGKTGWYATNQFSLEVIFHNRMKQYKCLTSDSSVASAIFVPYYVGLDVARYLWNSNRTLRDAGSLDLVRWLRRRSEWNVMGGKDHFLVAGRIVWDFRRENDRLSDWGSNLMLLPESMNMTILVLESSLLPKGNDFAIPYPTYFHPSKDIEVSQWQSRMRRQKRRYLFSFAGAPRKNLSNSIRDEIISQCGASRRKCKLLECNSRGNKCHKPIFLMKLFQSSIFCLQPPGDSYTRRSAFDSILSGCIPVFFHSGSAYEQYKWHLPGDHSKYSVFIPENQVKDGKVAIEKLLLRIPQKDVSAMRGEVIRLIPTILYADPTSELENLEDAFDVSVKGVLERVQRIREESLG